MEDEDPISLYMDLDDWQDPPLDQEQGSSSQDSQYPSSFSDTFMLGFVVCKMIRIQDRWAITGPEMVGLVREPFNPEDGNAIQVLTMWKTRIAYIAPRAAAVLSPLLDSRLISVEGVVPCTPGRRHIVPCIIHIFAPINALSYVKSEIERGGLTLTSGPVASYFLWRAKVVKEKSEKKSRSVDEIFKLVDENVRKKGALEPLEPPKEVIKSELLAHQKEGLSWLFHRENNEELPPFWEEINGSYVNMLRNYHADKRPEPLRGGIFSDDTGMGKTLTLLSLIAFDNYGAANVKGESVCVNDESLVQSDTKTTLVVCPPSGFSTWITQLREHTRHGKLRFHIYYGKRTDDAEKLKKYDIVMTTYGTLGSENCNINSPIKKIEWWRVILDEAHAIKNENAKQTLAVTNLKSKRRWVVTGARIQNGSFDLFSLIVFLRFEPFSIKKHWERLVQQPLAQGNNKGLSRLQVLMSTISLRRVKENGIMGLPPRTVEIFYVELSNEEREHYEHVEAQARGVVWDYIHADRLMHNYSTVLSIILQLRQICDSSTLYPPDLNSLTSSTNIEDVSNNPKLLKKMVEVLQDGEDFDCPICMCPPTSVVITRCAHIFCRDCILKTLQRTQPCCPLCRRHLSQSDLFSSPQEPADADDVGEMASRITASSKVLALLQLLAASRDQNPASKSVVFSQFRKMLILLEKVLKASGFKTLRLDGSMNAKRKAHLIAEFVAAGEDGPTVLLASLKASCAGINLTAASRVYLLEPWWNPAVEEQAMSTVHRIGQKEHVKIVKLIIKNSIEGRLLELQERKKQLARDAFGRRGMKAQRKIRIDDLRTLMSL